MDAHLIALRDTCRVNKRAMQDALREQFGGGDVSWTDPEGGFFLWLNFPAHVTTASLAETALEEGVAFIPGTAFSVSGRFENALRLSFASNSPERTVEGVRRLRAALDRAYGQRWRREER